MYSCFKIPFFIIFTVFCLMVVANCSSDDKTASDGDIDNDSDKDGYSDNLSDGDLDLVDGVDVLETDENQETELEAVTEPLPFAAASKDAAPDPMAFGPFVVGVTTFTFYDKSRIDKKTGLPRRLKTEVWYPARQKHKDDKTYEYNLADQCDGEDLGEYMDVIKNSDLAHLITKTVWQAEIDKANAPYPVILFSHGANGIRFQSIFYTQHLASHGYIVVAPDHLNNTLWDIIRDGYDQGSVIDSAVKRPYDISFVLDKMLEFNDDETSMFYQTIDKDNIGISGHSFGGFTSVCLPCRDDRIKIAIPHSPIISLAFTCSCHFEDYAVPILVMGGTKDKTLPWNDQYCEYRDIKGVDKFLYELERGGHFTFSDMCTLDLVSLAEEINFGNATEAMSDGCSETENINYKDAHKSINYYSTAFANYYLRNSKDSMKYLVEKSEYPFDSVNFYTGDDLPDWPDTPCKSGE